MNFSSRIPVLVAHGQPLVRAGLAATLGRTPDIEVALQAPPVGSGAAAGAAQVLVLDCAEGLRVAHEQRHRAPHAGRGPAILILCTQAGEWEIRQAICLGVQGLHLMETPLDRVVAGVRALAAGGRSFDDGVTARMADCLLLPLLTPREREVLALLSDGACNKEIARRLRIALGTVKAHVRTLLEKLQVDSRVQAIVVARARGIVGPAPAAAAGSRSC